MILSCREAASMDSMSDEVHTVKDRRRCGTLWQRHGHIDIHIVAKPADIDELLCAAVLSVFRSCKHNE